ncbi:phosphoesterase [Campylobacter sp. RM16191]|uniref:phosphoesterase n=2 Tax=unclassified Campylobacter TaxID=2593542 RepID=UPI001475066F|nr:phosphoesterase [Campylobacter sp. RM16191]
MNSNIFFTSDLHFGHKSVLNFCPCFRNFRSVDEMDHRLIELWNYTVGANDEIYNLGDFSFYRDIEKTISISKRLNGKHTLILGNHDELIKENRDELLKMSKFDGNRLFEEIVDYKELALKFKDDGYRLVLFHYPILEWNKGHYGSILLYGHVHDSISPLKGRALNVGYDLHGKILHLRDVISYTKDLSPFEHQADKKLSANDTIANREIKIRDILRANNER